MQETETLDYLVQQHPFKDYHTWWELGSEWSDFMSGAIVSEWKSLDPDNSDNLDEIEASVSGYLKTVYQQSKRPDLAAEFVNNSLSSPLKSGEFDALSYAFYKSAFSRISSHFSDDPETLNIQRREFTRKVGTAFSKKLYKHLDINISEKISKTNDFEKIKDHLKIIGKFLCEQGYLREHFAFDFNVSTQYGEKVIQQSEAEFIDELNNGGTAYAIYEMGYPAILPSAVYLYHGIGEAQHHSSRMIEDFFSMAGCKASETDDFDPVGYPSDSVVELWEIRKT